MAQVQIVEACKLHGIVPRLGLALSMETVNIAILHGVQRLGYVQPTTEQAEAVRELVLGKDVFVSLPTGSGKSLCFASLPFVFDYLRESAGLVQQHHTIVICVCPLSSLMQDQVVKYGARGLKAAFVGRDQTDPSVDAGVEMGDYQLVYMSPECMLAVPRWREMFRSEVYQQNLVALAIDEAHCVEKWGAEFRTEFSRIAEIRALLPTGTNIVAATATATTETRSNIIQTLDMMECHVISEVPNKLNIKYMVVAKPTNEDNFLKGIIEHVSSNGVKADRQLVFCRTYDDTTHFFRKVAVELGRRDALYTQHPIPKEEKSKYRVVDKYDACTSLSVKRNITESFTQKNGNLRVVFATTAFSMGLDSPDIRSIYHWGPPSDFESYLQETGRGGRDGDPCVAVLYVGEADLRSEHVSQAMIHYCQNEEKCLREILMQPFSGTSPIVKPDCLHNCCNVCEKLCSCDQCALPVADMAISMEELQVFEPVVYQSPSLEADVHATTKKEQTEMKDRLFRYRDRVLDDVTTVYLLGIELGTGLSDATLNAIAKNFKSVQTVSDLIDLGVPSTEQAETILHIIHDI